MTKIEKINQILDIRRMLDSRLDEEINSIMKDREDFNRLKESLEYVIDEKFRFLRSE